MCAATAGPRCLAVINRAATRQSQVKAAAGQAPAGLSPADIRSAYHLPPDKGGTVAVIEYGDYPELEADLHVYRSQFGLPECTRAGGCLTVVNQDAKASPLPAVDWGWAPETALDVDTVSATCPSCHIIVVEATPDLNELTADRNLAANNAAAALGANAASNSWGSADAESYVNDPQITAGFRHPGMAITAATGDSGHQGHVAVPASYSTVTSVGGTTLTRDASPRGWSETAWSKAGSGCSTSLPQPGWQKTVVNGCQTRAIADVAAVADPKTGLAVYGPFSDKSTWAVLAGTSAAAPLLGTPNGLGAF